MSSIKPQARKYGFIEYLSLNVAPKLLGPQGWPEWFGGILLGLVNVLFFAWALKPFTIYSGYLNWGQHIYSNLLGLNVVGMPKASPLFETTSIGDIGLFLGAFVAAVLAGEFKLRLPSRRLDVLEGGLGGLLMALGVVLAAGCNWGGYFSAIAALSFHGYLMFVGLLAGGFIGALYVEWRTRREFERLELEVEDKASEESSLERRSVNRSFKLLLGLLVTGLLLWYMSSVVGGEKFAIILLMGIVVGVVLQRCRFCFASAFRDILRGGGEFRRSARLQVGIALGILVGASGVAVLKYMGYVSLEAYVKASGWSNVIGGVLFGLGMVIAGACASGSLWRAAEGHVKIWIALLAAVLSYAPLRYLVRKYASWIYGPKISLVSTLGWAWGLTFIYLTNIAWILAVLYLTYKRGIKSG